MSRVLLVTNDFPPRRGGIQSYLVELVSRLAGEHTVTVYAPQWKGADAFDAQTAGYRVVRHPIYTSMLCLLCCTGLMTTSLLWLAMALAIFVVGTEIRIRIEEGLLASRFGEGFFDYRRRVSAYIPFLR